MKVINEVKLEFLARSVNEGFARATAGAFFSQLDPTIDEINDIKTAVSEAVTNVIVHAYPETMGKVYLTCRICENSYIEIIIKDKGKGIEDIEQAKAPMFTTGSAERSGMGFTIMESFMTTLSIRSKTGAGTTVKMTRKLRHN